MNRTLLLATVAACTCSLAAYAKESEKKEIDQTPPVYQAVLDCKSISDPTERLACYDRTVGDMETASAKRDLLVTDRSTVKEVQKGLFGLTLPKIKIFGGSDEDEVKEIESTISSFRRDENGALIITIADGARWRQIDNETQGARVGDKVKIRKGSFGSYFANINGRSAIRVTRLAN